MIATVALVVVEPRDLPDALRKFGRTIAGLRRMATQYRSQFQERIKDSELDEVRTELQMVRSDLEETAAHSAQNKPATATTPGMNGSVAHNGPKIRKPECFLGGVPACS